MTDAPEAGGRLAFIGLGMTDLPKAAGLLAPYADDIETHRFLADTAR